MLGAIFLGNEIGAHPSEDFKTMSLLIRILVCRLAIAALFGSTISLPSTTAFAATAGPPAYRLGPQDKLDVRVYDVRPGSGEVRRWAAFNGDFSIDASGAISLPVIGEVAAGGLTTAELGQAIASRLKTKIGLAQSPNAVVEVVKHRPFYVMGAVEKPGEYEFEPGLTVLQAVSMAGGMLRPEAGQLIGLERDALAEQGDLTLLAAQRLSLLARQARLDAQISGAEAISWPTEVKTEAGEPNVSKAISTQQLLFDARKQTLQSQIEAVQASKTLFNKELATLSSKDASLTQQLDLSRKELSQVNKLVSKGLAVVPQQLASEQNTAAFEGSRLDVQLARLRAQEDLSATDREIVDLRGKWRDDALKEAADVRSQLDEIDQKIKADEALIDEARLRAPMAMADDQQSVQPTYVLTEFIDGASHTRIVAQGDPIEPGNVLQVQAPKRPVSSENAAIDPLLGSGRSAASPPGPPPPVH